MPLAKQSGDGQAAGDGFAINDGNGWRGLGKIGLVAYGIVPV